MAQIMTMVAQGLFGIPIGPSIRPIMGEYIFEAGYTAG